MSRPWSVKWELAAKYSCFIWAQSIQLHLMEIIERIKCVLLCGYVYLCLSKECPPFYLDWAFIALSTELFVHSEKNKTKKKTCKYSDVKCCSSISSAILSGALKSAQTDLRSARESAWPFWAVIYHTGSFQLSPFVSDHRDLWAFVSNLIWAVNVNAGGTRFSKALCGESEQGPVWPTNGQMLFKSPSSSGQVPQSKRNLMGIISSADKQYITRRKEIK